MGTGRTGGEDASAVQSVSPGMSETGQEVGAFTSRLLKTRAELVYSYSKHT